MTRRSVLRISAGLAVVLGAGAVLVATGSSATATNGDAVKAGQTTTATNQTIVFNTNVGGLTCSGATNDGLLGCGASGVRGIGSEFGVFGIGNTGVEGMGTSQGVDGRGNTDGVRGIGGTNGVTGLTSNNSASGVYGENDGAGFGVAGRAKNGTGVLADSQDGAALSIQGKLVFNRSGAATVKAGKKSVRVSAANLTASTFFLATVQGSPHGVWVQSTARTSSTQFTIYLSKAPSRAVKVAWFVVN